MAAITTFLVGTVVGGGAKWAYDKWQDREDKPDLSITAVREKSATTARNIGQSISNVVRRRKSDPAAEEPTAATDASDAAANDNSAAAVSA